MAKLLVPEKAEITVAIFPAPTAVDQLCFAVELVANGIEFVSLKVWSLKPGSEQSVNAGKITPLPAPPLGIAPGE